ncbi:hypothetical protein AgCh_008476 [Apium graveolens]
MALFPFIIILVLALEHPILGNQASHQQKSFTSRSRTIVTSPKQFRSFRSLGNGVPVTNSTEEKLSWLRSQVIGGNAVFETPFGERLLTYADHTATSRGLQHIEDYILDNVLPFYGNSHTSDSYVGQQTTKMVNEASKYVKKCLGGGQDDALIFCGSGTTAAIKRLQEVMGISIPSILRERVLAELKITERWVVFVGPCEHHSNILSWRQSLAEVVEIGLDKDGLLDTDDLILQLEYYSSTSRPMLGSFSACSNVDGTYTDTRALAYLLHQYGAFACFDFAASGPYVEIDMRSGEMDGYDALFLSPHKFVGGPGSPGILMMNKALYQLKSSPPSTCGGGTVKFVNCFSEKDTLYIEDIEEREDAGTPPIIQKIRAASAFWMKEYIGYKAISSQEHNYTKRALERLLRNPNIRVLGNTSKSRQAIISFLVHTTTQRSSNDLVNQKNSIQQNETGNKHSKPLHGRFVAKLLNDLFGIQARGGCACAAPYGHRLLNLNEPASSAIRSAIQKGNGGARPGWTRISFPYYMSNEEFEFILEAVEFTATYGQRFLPIYNFNWKTGAWTLKKEASMKGFPVKGNCEPDMTEATIVAMTKDVEITSKYASYMDTAKEIACLLPKFPSQRPVPDGINADFLTFRV